MGATNPNAGGAPGGGGKGGMGQGQARPMAAFGQMNNLHQGLGSAGAYGPSAGVSQMPAQQGPAGAPIANWQSMMQRFPGFLGGGHGFGRPMPGHRPDMSQFGNLDMTYGKLGGGGNNPAFGGGLNVSGPQQMPAPSMPTADPRPMNWKPNHQPYQPSTGWEGGQPAQWAAQAAAINNPPPRTTAAGLPAGGILAKLYGG